MLLRAKLGHLSLRTRLTIWVVGISTIIKLTVGVVFYLYQADAVNAFFNQHIEARSEAMLGRLAAKGEAVTREDLEELAAQQSRNAMFTGFILSVYDAQGNLVVTMRQREPKYPLSRDELRETANSLSVWYRRRPSVEYKRIDAEAGMVRTIVRGYIAGNGQRFVLTASTSDLYAERMLGMVARALLVVVPTGVLISGVCGWFIAGVAVRPLEEVRQAASQLSPESIDRHVLVGTTSPELNRLQQELESARARMAAAFAAQERFMSNVSHEIKTPIAIMLTEAQTLDLKGAGPDVSAFVRSACEELRRLGGMVDSFLLLTRVREGRSLSNSRLYPINELLMESIAHCGPMALQYEVRLEPVLCGDDLEVAVRGDPALLRTMIDNLVRNAIRFSPKGRTITVSAATEDDRVLIRVRDHGAGIPESVINHIFDRFVQAPDEQRRGRGHGLGLEIAQGIAELHGGQIGVRNCGGSDDDGHAGCEFTVVLPRAVETSENARQLSARVVESPVSSATLSG